MKEDLPHLETGKIHRYFRLTSPSSRTISYTSENMVPIIICTTGFKHQ